MTCELRGDGQSCGLSDDDEQADSDPDMELTLPPEQLSQDLDLNAEMELDQQLWFRYLDLEIGSWL